MTSGHMVIDLSPESKDPCKHFMLDFFKCSKGKEKSERRKQCDDFGYSYLKCRGNPDSFKVARSINKT